MLRCAHKIQKIRVRDVGSDGSCGASFVLRLFLIQNESNGRVLFYVHENVAA